MLTAAFRRLQATFTRRNRTPMRTGPGMAQERADAGGGFRRENVLEFTSLFRDFLLIVHVKGLSEKTLRQAMAADHVFCALASFLGEDDHAFAMPGEIR